MIAFLKFILSPPSMTQHSRQQNWLGPKTGDTLAHACRGIDTSPLETTHERKSIGIDVNYGTISTNISISR